MIGCSIASDVYKQEKRAVREGGGEVSVQRIGGEVSVQRIGGGGGGVSRGKSLSQLSSNRREDYNLDESLQRVKPLAATDRTSNPFTSPLVLFSHPCPRS